MMVLITLIGGPQAKVGNRFYYMGPLAECRECRLKGVCSNLETGHMYEIKGLRDTEHDCEVHESKARVVEVEKVPIPAAVHSKKAIDGSMITYEQVACDIRGCANRVLCRPVSLKDGMKLSITEVVGDIECMKGERLAMVRLL